MRGRSIVGAAVVGLALVSGSCGRTPDAGEPPVATSTTSAESSAVPTLTPWRCETLLRLDDLLRRSSAGEDVLADLRAMTVPDDFDEAWTDLLALQEAAVAAGVPPDDVADGDVVDAGLRAIDTLDFYVATQPCDPEGLDADVGCDDLEQCARSVLDDPDPRIATGSVAESLATAGAMTLGNCSTGGETVCSVSTDDLTFYLRLGRTSDGRYFAWRVKA